MNLSEYFRLCFNKTSDCLNTAIFPHMLVTRVCSLGAQQSLEDETFPREVSAQI